MNSENKSINSLVRAALKTWYPDQKPQHEQVFEFVSVPEQFDGMITGKVRCVDIGKMPISREVNVRESFSAGPVSDARMDTLFTDGPNFVRKNKGIDITVASAQQLNERTFRVKFVNSSDHGVPDGGGTFFDIQKAVQYDVTFNEFLINRTKSPDPNLLAEAKAYRRNLSEATVPVTIHVGATKAQIKDISKGKNLQNNVSSESRMDQEGVFDEVKKAFGKLSDNVAWYQNRGKEKNAKEMELSIGTIIKLWLALSDLYHVDQSKSYSSLDSARKKLSKHYKEDAFVRAAKFVPKMYEIYETVCKAVSGHKRSWTSLDKNLVQVGKETEYFLTGGTTSNAIFEPAAMPVVMALRTFIEPDYSGWSRDPFEFLAENGKALIEKVFEDHDLLGGDATSFGKESRPFEDVHNLLQALLAKESRRRN